MDSQKIQEAITRKQLEDDLRDELESAIKERVSRYLEVGHQKIIGAHHFAPASTECLLLYRDGRFIGTVMMSHALNEAIIRFVAERNPSIALTTTEGAKSLGVLITELRQAGKISDECATASQGIYGSFRADVHHMNPMVASIDFRSLAQRNIQRLATIENEIFAYDIVDGGKMKPRNPAYWDVGSDGYTTAYLRIRF